MNNGTLLSGTIARILPENFEKLDTMPPVAILRQLAYELGRKTRNVVEGDVRTVIAGNEGYRYLVHHIFELVAPALDGIRYELFRIEQDVVSPYPIELRLNRDDKQISKVHSIKNESELIATLEQVFSSDQTKKIIASLITQSTAVVPSGLGDEDES